MKKKKYALGTPIDYIESPSEELTEHQTNVAEALYEGNSNPLVLGMQALGGVLMNAGMQGIQSNLAGGQTEMANGGLGKGMVEVEGEEMYETASGEVGKFKGPKHEQGGIDVNLTEPTNVYSDRILIKGKSIAKRKEYREKKLKALEKKMQNNPKDNAIKNSYERTKQALELEEKQDLDTQAIVSLIAGKQGEAMFGLNANSGILDFFKNIFAKDKSHQGDNPNIDYDAIDETFKNLSTDNIDASVNGATEIGQDVKSSPLTQDTGNNNLSKTFGDLLGLTGNAVSGLSPLLTTLENRATDTPNINAFKNFGEDALDRVDESKALVDDIRDNALKDVERNAVSSKRQARRSSRSVNTQRATDLVIDQSTNQANEDIYNNFAQQMIGILNSQAQLENQQDQVVMQGEQNRDLADRQDRDNFYTNKSQALATLGQAIQQTGKDLNDSEQQKIIKTILNQMSKYGVTFDSDFQLQNPG